MLFFEVRFLTFSIMQLTIVDNNTTRTYHLKQMKKTIPFQGNERCVKVLDAWGMLYVISLEAHVKSIQDVIGT